MGISGTQASYITEWSRERDTRVWLSSVSVQARPVGCLERTRGRKLRWNGDTLTLWVLCVAGKTINPSFFVLQSKPLIPLQKEEDPETHKTVLTNYMFPQQIRTDDCEYHAFGKTKFLFTSSQTFKRHLFLTQFYRNVDVVGLKLV